MKSKLPLKNKRVLVTAGPTREYLDPVRYISNDSSGKMGYALARSAREMGAKVTLISGPTNLKSPEGLKFISVTTAKEMHQAAVEAYKTADIAICAAAVADFRPVTVTKSKIKKDAQLNIKLTANPDILASLGKKKRKNQKLVGFALETENLKKNAIKKLKEKNCDYIVANSPKNIGSDLATALLISKDKTETIIRQKNKSAAAKIILGTLV